MKNSEVYKVIGKLTNAIISLSVIIICLVVFIFLLLSFKPFKDSINEPSNMGYCGVISKYEPLNLPQFRGQTVFDSNCASCHFLHKDMTGPASSGVLYRAPYQEWFFDYLTNQDSLLNAKEPYTLLLQKKWNNEGYTRTHNYDNLSQEQFNDLLIYIN